MPTNITYSTGSTIAYTYDAAGKKLHVAYGSPNSTTDYCGNMIYENGTLTKILVDGGYITFSGTAPVYHYYLKDHQGNNRVVMSSSGTVEQVNHYFPYGYLFGESTNSGTQKYKYNDKEFDMTHGLHWYYYGARHYDPCIMRFTTMDPMCEKYYNLSPYAYCGNNPVNAVDPSGMIWENPEEAKQLVGKIENKISSLDRKIHKMEQKIAGGNLSKKKIESYNARIGDYKERISNLNQSIEDITLLGIDDHIYTFANVDGGRHSVYESSGKVYIEKSSIALAIHEITHVRQSLMAGGLSFNPNGYLLNIGSPRDYEKIAAAEIEAYKKQFSFDESFPGRVKSLQDINVKSVGNIRDEKGRIVYNSIYNYYKYQQKVNQIMGK